MFQSQLTERKNYLTSLVFNKVVFCKICHYGLTQCEWEAVIFSLQITSFTPVLLLPVDC